MTGKKEEEPPFSSPEAKAKIKKSGKAARKFEADIKEIIEDAREEEREAEKKNPAAGK